MGKINILEKHVAELIAAGEVVERPASVVKELVENSIDAGASVVTVEIKNGGVSLIRVTDNGSGIAREDVPAAFLRHATSKVAVKDDLDSIATLGFRGEALASIAAMARVNLLTRTAEEELGTSCRIEGGDMQPPEDAGCPVGTTLLVRDLFFNTPARMKFLKKDVVEGNAVAAVIDNMALSHPEVSIRLIRDGREALHTPGDGKLQSTIYSVFGKEFASSLIPVDYTYEKIHVYGAICLPRAARASRSMQRFFINGRSIRSRTAMAALEEAYKGSIMVGKFPACVLHMQLSFSAVDVNVHPSKLEVRFADERPVFNAVFHAVKSALLAGDRPKEMQLKPQPSPFEDHSVYRREPVVEQTVLAPAKKVAPPAASSWLSSILDDEPAAQTNRLSDSAADVAWQVKKAEPVKPAEKTAEPQSFQTENEFLESIAVETPPLPETAPPAPIDEPAAEEPDAKQEIESTQPEESVSVEVETKEEKVFRVIGEAFSTYIFMQYGPDSVVVIDKHAAHERMLYNKLREENGNTYAQTLLAPVPVTLEKNEYAAVLQHLSVLSKMGFEAEDFGDGTILLRTAPLNLGAQDAADALMEIASYLVQNKNDLSTEHQDWIYHNVACRAAIKGGDKSSDYELTRFVKMLLEQPEVRYCPHGRPVYIILKKRELEKQFGRIV